MLHFLKKEKTRLLLSLLFLAPLVEVLTGSTPISELSLWSFALFTLLYGVGVIMARELIIRWDLKWSAIFIAMAYGFFEEGMLTQTMLFPGHPDVMALSNLNVWAGIQWAWTIKLLWLHSIISVFSVLFIIQTLFPNQKNTSLIKRRGWKWCLSSWLLLLILWFIAILKRKGIYTGYSFKLFPFIVITLMFIASIVAAYIFRNKKIKKSNKPVPRPSAFFMLGFLLEFFHILLPNIIANISLPHLVLPYQIILLVITFFVLLRYIYNINSEICHISYFVAGNLVFFLFLQLLIGIVKVNFLIYSIQACFVFFPLIILWLKRICKKNTQSKLQ